MPPVHSPLALGDVVAGAGAVLGLGRRDPSQAIAAELRARELLLLDSGTSALTLAMRGALESRKDAAVALPAFCCYDLATAADGANAPVVLYDVDPATLGPDPASLRRALGENAAAVVVVHLFGIPVDMSLIAAEARAAGAVVIEDAAQGAGGALGERPLGSLGSVSVLSFGRGKGVTGGGGGALLGLDETGAGIVARVRNVAAAASGGVAEGVKLSAQWALGRPSLYGIPASLPFLELGETIYHPPHPATRMSALAARVVAETWSRRAKEADHRRSIAGELLAAAPASFGRITAPRASRPGYLRLPLLATDAARAAAATPEARRLGIMPSYPKSLADLPGFGRWRNTSEPLAGARTLAARLITLPTHGQLSSTDVARLVDWLRRAGQ